MAKNVKSLTARKFVITQDVESSKISLAIEISFDDNTSERHLQVFDLKVMPYDMAMSVICSLINPPRNANK